MVQKFIESQQQDADHLQDNRSSKAMNSKRASRYLIGISLFFAAAMLISAITLPTRTIQR